MAEGVDDGDEEEGDGEGNVVVVILVVMGTKVWLTELVLGTEETEVAAARTALAAFK